MDQLEQNPDLFSLDVSSAITQTAIHLEYFSLELLSHIKDHRQYPNTDIALGVKNLQPDLLKKIIEDTIKLIKEKQDVKLRVFSYQIK